jgi:hypothetical protein
VVRTALVNGGLPVRDSNPDLDALHGQPIRRAVTTK